MRSFRIGMTLLAMTTVALLSALITMRLAVHTGEVETPNLVGMTLEDAAMTATGSKLNLTVENRFYSTTVPTGRVLSQSPVPGAKVRKGWHMRVTESIGPQKVAIPNAVGLNEREAAMMIRRASLDIGTTAHLASPGAADVVLAQTPPANAEGVDKPEVSLLLTEPETTNPKAYVMPNLVGMSYSATAAKMREMELRVYGIVPVPVQAVDPNNPTAPVPPPPPMVPAGVVLSQTPAAGMRVTSAEVAKVKMSAAAPADSVAPAVPAASVANPAR